MHQNRLGASSPLEVDATQCRVPDHDAGNCNPGEMAVLGARLGAGGITPTTTGQQLGESALCCPYPVRVITKHDTH